MKILHSSSMVQIGSWVMEGEGDKRWPLVLFLPWLCFRLLLLWVLQTLYLQAVDMMIKFSVSINHIMWIYNCEYVESSRSHMSHSGSANFSPGNLWCGCEGLEHIHHQLSEWVRPVSQQEIPENVNSIPSLAFWFQAEVSWGRRWSTEDTRDSFKT